MAREPPPKKPAQDDALPPVERVEAAVERALDALKPRPGRPPRVRGPRKPKRPDRD